MIERLLTLSICVALLPCGSKIDAQHLPLCEALNEADAHPNDLEYSEVKIRRVRAICDAIYSSQSKAEEHDLNTMPEFDLTQIQSDQDAEQILRRFRRRGGRGGGGSSGGRSGGGSRFSSSGSRSSSSSSSSGSRIFSRSSSSSSSGSGTSRIFSRSSGSSSSSGTGSSGSRIFSRSSSSSSGSAGSSRIFSRSSGSSGTPSERSSVRIFSRTPSSSHTGSRIREAVRTMIHKPSSSSGSGTIPGAGGAGVISGPKPSLGDKIRKITHSGGGGGSSIFSGSHGMSGGSGSGSSAWVRAGKKFLPHAVRFGKRYYQRRKYSKGMYAGAGAGAGYYAGSRMSHHTHHYPNSYYGYPPVVDQVPDQIEGKTPTVFYCIQEDLNATLVNATLNDEGIGTCNISGKLVTCPIEIECQLSEADNCCEDELGTPYCCGGPIPIEYATEYGGYGDDAEDAAETLHQMLNMFTALCALLATICFTMWQRQGA